MPSTIEEGPQGPFLFVEKSAVSTIHIEKTDSAPIYAS
jgi:hypothetical protein